MGAFSNSTPANTGSVNLTARNLRMLGAWLLTLKQPEILIPTTTHMDVIAVSVVLCGVRGHGGGVLWR